MIDEEKLFQQNPLKAIWLKVKENQEEILTNREILNEALDDLDVEDNKSEEDGSYDELS